MPLFRFSNSLKQIDTITNVWGDVWATVMLVGRISNYFRWVFQNCNRDQLMNPDILGALYKSKIQYKYTNSMCRWRQRCQGSLIDSRYQIYLVYLLVHTGASSISRIPNFPFFISNPNNFF